MIQLAISVDENFFNQGWLACLLGLPNKYPVALKLVDNQAFIDGWEMCEETGVDAWQALPKMLADEILVPFWIASNGAEIYSEDL